MVPKKVKETTSNKEDLKESNNIDFDEDNIVEDEDIVNMDEWYDQNLIDIKVGQVVNGEIMDILEDAILVDIKYKSEGVIPIDEFITSYQKKIPFKVGDKIDVYLENTEDKNGRVVLSKKKADYYFAWDKVADAYTKNIPITGRVIKRVKGGLSIDINGIFAFLPASQVDLTIRQDLDFFVGKNIEMKIIKLNRARNNIVLSRRIILEEERNKNRSTLLKEIDENQIRKGIVKNITNFGAFIDLGGVDGLLHITDISWGRISHPSELLHVGQEIDVKILSFDKESGKISLGLKQKTDNPWNNIAEKYKLGDKVKGKIVSMTDYGTFIELEEGVEGLVHISEMSWTKRIEHPSELVKIGDIIDVVVLNINKEEKKISLGIKQTQPNPWDKIETEFPIGTKLKRKIKNVVDFGVFIEINDGIDGLVHISDFSWAKHYNSAQEVYKKDDKIEAVILSIDKDNQKILLGIKQLEPNPWEEIAKKYPEGSTQEVKILEINDNGIIAELETDVTGMIPSSQIENKKDLNVGDTIIVKISRLNLDTHKITFSQKAFTEDEEKKDVDDYISNQKDEIASIGDIIGTSTASSENKEE